MPKVFDPLAGGGAIPLEAAGLGCNSYGKDEFVKIYSEKELDKQQENGNVFGDIVKT